MSNKAKIRIQVLFSGVLILVMVFLITLVSVVNISPNPISLNHRISYKSKLKALLPQGWAFFTKNVKEDEGVNIYEFKAKNEYDLIDLNSFGIQTLFGVKRTNRVIGHKFTAAVNKTVIDDWYSYKGDINKIPLDSLKTIKLKLESSSLKGKFLIEKGLQLSYEWFISKSKIYTTNKYVLVEIE